MKHGRISRMLVVTTILTLLAVVIPATPVMAATISVTPTTGKIGDSVDVIGYAFTSGTLINIYFSNGKASVDDFLDAKASSYEKVGQDTTGSGADNAGEFETSFEVPDMLTEGNVDMGVVGGTYYVYAVFVDATNNKRVRALAQFTVVSSAEITIDPEEGQVETEVVIGGTGFRDREFLIVEYDDREIDIANGDERTTNSGDFESTIIIPESKVGKHTISVSDESGSVVEATFTVLPQTSIDKDTGIPGDSVNLKGTGFSSSSDVSITFGETKQTKKTDRNGSFQITLTVPQLNPGIHPIEAKDKAGNLAQSEFTIKTQIAANISSTTGPIGARITITGSGFLPNTAITVKYDTAQVASTPADAKGVFSVPFPVPPSKFGNRTIIVSDGKNSQQFTFAVESEAPAIPSLLTPESGEKLKEADVFEWESVSDASGVTYTFQIATSKGFTESSLVVNKPGLTEPEYTLTEKLEPLKDKAPYYWRVKAIDGASNESSWSAVGTFVISSGISIGGGGGGWVKYVVYVLGGLALLILGFFLGRKSAYY